MKKQLRTVLVLALWWTAVPWAAAQQRVQFNLTSQAGQAEPGAQFEAILETQVEEGWHLYSMTQPKGGPIPTTVVVEDNPVFRLDGDVVQPPVRKVFDPNFEIDTEFIEGDSEFLIPVRVDRGAAPGVHPLTVKIRFMVCSDTMCLPPQTKKLQLDFKVSGAAKLVAAESSPGSAGGQSLARPAFQGELMARLEKVEWTLHFEGQALSPEAVGKASLGVEIQEGWHIYSMTQKPGGPIKTTIKIVDNPAFELAALVVQPSIQKVFDPNFDMEAEYIDGGEFVIPFLVRGDVPDGIHPLQVEVRYSVCNDSKCLPPQTKTLTAAVQVASGGSAGLTQSELAKLAATSGSAAPLAESSQPAPQESAAGQEKTSGLPQGVLAYIGLAMAMGALALLTPCVFPMIPITVSYFTKRKAKSRGQAIREAGLYSLGIISTFTVLGFTLTLLLGAGGINSLAASPPVNFFIAAVFILFALSLFGVLEIKLPESWLNAVNRKSTKTSGVIGILLMALTFSLTSFTCTVPFVGTVMVAALDGDWLWSLLGVTAFATVFSAPFFLLAIFPSWLQSLPKSGNWMNSVKITMGFIELAAAVKFLSNIDLVYQWEFLTRPVFITIWLAIAIVTSAYLLGWFRFNHETPSESIGAMRMLSAVFFLSISFYLLRGLFGFPLGELDAFLPPRNYGGLQASFMAPGVGRQNGEELEWGTDYQAALAKAERQNRPVFIDFTGYTCTNCRWMEGNMFPLAEVHSRFQEMVLVQLYTDGTGAEHEANSKFEQERFGTIALPLYVIMSPQGEVLAKYEGLTRDPEEFVAFLDKGLRAHGADKLVLKAGRL